MEKVIRNKRTSYCPIDGLEEEEGVFDFKLTKLKKANVQEIYVGLPGGRHWISVPLDIICIINSVIQFFIVLAVYFI